MCALIVQAYPTFQPAVRIISAITNDFPALVTTTFAPGQVNSGNQYESGIRIRLEIPRQYGMYEADQLFGQITVVDSNNFTIDIDTRYFTAFSVPVSPIRIYSRG